MTLLAVNFLLLFTLQSVPALQQPTPPPAPKPDAQATTSAPAAPPVTLPAAKASGLIIPSSPPAESVGPNDAQMVLSAEEVQRALAAIQTNHPTPNTVIVVENGAAYVSVGGFKVPLFGGGASGCFGVTPERNEQIQKAIRLQMEKEKTAPEKDK